MRMSKPNAITLETVHTHTHTHTHRFSKGYLGCNKKVSKNIKTQNLYSVFVINEDT